MALPFPIDYGQSFLKLSAFIAHSNASKTFLAKQLRQPVIATAKELIRIYGLALLKARDTVLLSIENLLSLCSNNTQLSKLLVCSPGTIQHHISKLIETDVITHKKWHGSNNSYELWINSEVLFINGVKAIKKPQKGLQNQKTEQIENQIFKNTITSICHHTDTSYNSRNINNILIDAHKNVSSLSLLSGRTGNTAGHTREKVSKKILTRKKVLKRDTRQADAQVLSQQSTSRSTFLKGFVDFFWELAKETLYKDEFLLEYQVQQAKELLLKWYTPVESSELERVDMIYRQRLELVKKFISKDLAKRFIPPPFLYFDPTNKNGFAGTRAWWKAHQRRKAQAKLKGITHAQIRLFLNNENKPTCKQKPRIELFRSCESRISKGNRPKLLHAFYSAVLTRDTNQLFHKKNQV